MTYKAFKILQQRLDDLGLMTCIHKIGKHPKRAKPGEQVTKSAYPVKYEVQINGEVVKSYRTRASAKRLLWRKFQDLQEQEKNQILSI